MFDRVTTELGELEMASDAIDEFVFPRATAGTEGCALNASEGIRMPGEMFGETGKSLRGLESRCVGTLRETARCNTPREAIEPPRSTISWRDRNASVLGVLV